MTKKRSLYSKSLILIISIFLLIVNGFLGTVLILQSNKDLRQEMSGRMLDILNSASALLDGDILSSLQKEDYDTPQYQNSLKILRSYQENFDLDYIYCVREFGDKQFGFIIDPDEENPGAFGELIEYTEALKQASLGLASVDKEPSEDRWGRFYSAYCPVFDSEGKVGGIIAVDVEASWYEKKLQEHIITTLIVCIISLIVGGIIVYLFTEKIRKRLDYLNSEMNHLSDEVEDLAVELRLASGFKSNAFDAEYLSEKKDFHVRLVDGFEELCERLKFVRKELQKFIEEAHEMAYTDALTGTGNRNAYIESLKHLNNQIKKGKAAFSIAVFDINGLKNANDSFGHEFGDLMIVTAAEVLKNSVEQESLFRIGGDEFVALIDKVSEAELSEIFQNVDSAIAEKNSKIEAFKIKSPLAISKGVSSFNPENDSDVKNVFRRADDAMYADKTAYYKTHDRRRKR